MLKSVNDFHGSVRLHRKSRRFPRLKVGWCFAEETAKSSLCCNLDHRVAGTRRESKITRLSADVLGSAEILSRLAGPAYLRSVLAEIRSLRGRDVSDSIT